MKVCTYLSHLSLVLGRDLAERKHIALVKHHKEGLLGEQG